MMSELNKAIANKATSKNDNTGKPLGSKLTYEEADNSFEYEDETLDFTITLSDGSTHTLPKFSLKFEEMEDSAYLNLVMEKKLTKEREIRSNEGGSNTKVSPINSKETSIPSQQVSLTGNK